MKVIVAGAGLAGLTAARALARAGASVTVIDARDRLGGRVHTTRDGFADGQHGELGGEFIDGDQKEIRGLCEELGLTLTRVLRSGFAHRFRGDDGGYHVSRTRPWTELEALVAPLVRRYRAAGSSSDAEAVKEMAAMSLREWLRQQNASPSQHSMADALRGFFIADPDDLSVLQLVEQAALGGSPAQTEVYRIEGGNDRLVEALARDSAARVLLRHRVTAIAQPADRVMVTVIDDRGHQQQLEGDRLVVTMPASTLRDVDVTPPFPERQWRAIRTIKYGCATKVLMETPEDPFRGRARAFATDTAVGAFWQGPGRVITFLGGGSTSRTLRARADAGARALLTELCWLDLPARRFDEAQLRLHARTWEDDAWARGGYAYLDPGFDPADRALLAQRAGRIVFAGEHTSKRWQGYMNGAVETALRAVDELISQSPEPRARSH